MSLKSIVMFVKNGNNCLNNHTVISKTIFVFGCMVYSSAGIVIVFISQLVMTYFEDFLVPTRNIKARRD